MGDEEEDEDMTNGKEKDEADNENVEQVTKTSAEGYFTLMNPTSGKYLTGNDPPNTLTIQAQYEEDEDDENKDEEEDEDMTNGKEKDEDDNEDVEQVTKTSAEGSPTKRTKRSKRDEPGDEPASNYNGKKI